MKTVCIHASFAPSILNFRKELILEIVKKHQVHVIIPTDSAEVIAQIESLGVSVHQIAFSRKSLNPLGNIKYCAHLIKCLNEVKPDVVINYTIKPVIWGSIAAKCSKVTEIYSMITGLGYAFTDIKSVKSKIINKTVRVLYKIALSLNTFVLFQNKDDATLFLQNKLVANDKVGIINGSGVNLDDYRHTPTFPEKVTFLMIARLIKHKGVQEYLKAVELVRKRYGESVVFELAGWFDDNLSSVSKAQLLERIKSCNVHFWGKLEDVRESLINSSVYVLPSYREGTPRSVLEAMSIGRAVITTDAAGCRETVQEGYNGFLVPVKDSRRLASAMIKFIENPALIAQMGRNSREYVEQKYDVHKVNQSILNFLKLNSAQE